jgi:hypothetical protein
LYFYFPQAAPKSNAPQASLPALQSTKPPVKVAGAAKKSSGGAAKASPPAPSASAAKKAANPNKPTKGPISLADIVIVQTSKKNTPQASKTPNSSKGASQNVTKAPQPPASSTKLAHPTPSSKGNASNVVISKVSGEAVVRRGKEREEVRPKRPTKLKQVILEERNERFHELKDTLGEDANVALDLRLEAHKNRLLKSGIKLALRTENQKMIERLKTVPKVPKESSSVAAAVHQQQQREYCRQLLTEDLDTKIFDMLAQLVVFQDRAKATNPLKAKMRRRLIVGFREVTRAVNLGKAKCVVMAPNIEDITSPSSYHLSHFSLIDRLI